MLYTARIRPVSTRSRVFWGDQAPPITIRRVPRPAPGSTTRTLIARLRHARLLLLLTTMVGALLALLVTQWRDPAFEATSQVQVAPALALSVAPFDRPDPQALVATEFEALRSDAVAVAARELLPDLTSDLSFAVDPDASILTVVARADDDLLVVWKIPGQSLDEFEFVHRIWRRRSGRWRDIESNHHEIGGVE